MNDFESHAGAKKTFTLTTPLYYVNDVPHIGSAYTTMAADTLARWARQQGKTVLSITGTDEHGQKIQQTAAARDILPQEHCDRIAASFTDLWQRLNIHYDRFSRTTAPRHGEIVREFFQRVWDRGDIYLDRKQGYYCVGCEEFKEERELLENKHCPLHPNQAAEWRDEQNYFFRLSRYQESLEALYRDRPDFIQPEVRRNEVLSFVGRGLKDFSISRTNVTWGLPVPTDADHTIYVWFDALLGYITALLPPDAAPTLDNALQQGWPIDVHLIGKDILRFHAIYWPAMLLSAGLDIPGTVFGHGFLTKNGQKMGKSLGNTLDPIALTDRYGPDAVRFYFLSGIKFGDDGDFNERRFVELLNDGLANNLGNLLNRTLNMAKKYCQSVIPETDIPADDALRNIGLDLGDRVARAYAALAIHRACEESLHLADAGNKYLDERAPWTLFNQGKQRETEQVIYAVLESVRLVAYLLAPVIPNLSSKIYQQLGFAIDFNAEPLPPFSVHARWGALPAGQSLAKAKPIFARLELPSEESI